MSLRGHRQAWEDLGQVDPMWAVLTNEARRHGRWDPVEFFATGERDIAAIMQSAQELKLPRERKLALDFGCGVGRLTRPLASYFESYVGVDISEAMIAQAKEWNRDCLHCRFVHNTTGDLRGFERATVDLIYTRYVLQHLPSNRLVRSYLSEFVRILRPGGLLVFQLPDRIGFRHRLQMRRRVYTVLRALGISAQSLLGRIELTPIRMRGLAEAKVTGLITELGAQVVKVDRGADLEQVYYATR